MPRSGITLIPARNSATRFASLLEQGGSRPCKHLQLLRVGQEQSKSWVFRDIPDLYLQYLCGTAA
jgi:hypothetical protein